MRETQTQGNNELIPLNSRDLLSRASSKRVRRDVWQMYSDRPMAFVAMDAQFRTSIECRAFGVPFVPCDLFASQNDANGTGRTDGDDDGL